METDDGWVRHGAVGNQLANLAPISISEDIDSKVRNSFAGLSHAGFKSRAKAVPEGIAGN